MNITEKIDKYLNEENYTDDDWVLIDGRKVIKKEL